MPSPRDDNMTVIKIERIKHGIYMTVKEKDSPIRISEHDLFRLSVLCSFLSGKELII